jgi:hypothetical protein
MMATKNPYQGGDYDFFEAARDETGAIRRETGNVSTPAAKTASKVPIVTKEQMRKAGFDNLRDYLNAQRGLTRRGEKPAAKTAPADTRRPGPTRERAADMPPMARRPDASTSRGVRAAEPAPRASTQPAAKTPARSGVQARADADRAARDARYEFGRQRKAAAQAEKPTSTRSLSRGDSRKRSEEAREARSKMSPAERSAARGQRLKEAFGAPKKMAKGGSVSARADGLAKRGKTKCKII